MPLNVTGDLTLLLVMLHPATHPKAKPVKTPTSFQGKKWELCLFTHLCHKVAADTTLISGCHTRGSSKQFKLEEP